MYDLRNGPKLGKPLRIEKNKNGRMRKRNWIMLGELANKKKVQLYKVSSPCLDDHQFKKEELESVGELSQVCSHIVLQCLYLARIGRPDILWSFSKIARSVTKWTQACDRRLARLTSSTHHTRDHHKRHKSQKKIDVMEDIDSVLSNVQFARQEALLYVFEDNEAVIKMIIKGRSPDNETCFQNPQSCSRLVGSIESIWILRSKSNTLTPKPTRRHPN